MATAIALPLQLRRMVTGSSIGSSIGSGSGSGTATVGAGAGAAENASADSGQSTASEAIAVTADLVDAIDCDAAFTATYEDFSVRIGDPATAGPNHDHTMKLTTKQNA